MSSKLFALDIGTRSVVGIILEEQNDHYHVVDMIMKEHKERAMVDGQIHNVLYVAELVKEIKQQFEKTYGPLTKVSVAAAGRALKTEQASMTVNIRNRPIFTEEDINRLELQAVQQAQAKLVQQQDDTNTSHYYCVGFSVLHYKLDGDSIGSLLDQQGEEATVEVIATFLPRVVVESLLAVLSRAQLEIEALTLEPIAAINVLIPPSMRRLNVALVDIGAGTSDIALTNNGTIVAYGMVPTAGDEITECLSDHFLLDFPIAEKAKRQLLTNDVIEMQDILGFQQQIPKEEVVMVLSSPIRSLAEAIGNEILKLNHQVPPKAVMLVGGGSLTPNLTEELCNVLQIPNNRVAIRGIDAIPNLSTDDTVPRSPELVTPIGIAIAARRAPIQYITVTVNGQVVRLFETKEMTVTDAFLAANIRAKQLYGKPGQGISITLNGQDLFIPGGHGEPAKIVVNGEEGSTKSIIKHGDTIELVEGKDGEEAYATVRDLLDSASSKTITIQNRKYTIEPTILVNDQPTSIQTRLHDRDQVTVEPIESVENVLKRINKHDLLHKLNSFFIHIDGQPMYLPEFSGKLFINERPAKLHYPIQDGDIITIEESSLPTVQMIAEKLDILLEEKIVITFQQEPLELKKTCNEVIVNGVVVQPTSSIQNGASVQMMQKDTSHWIFQDVFRFSNWQIPSNFKGQFTILRNGTPSAFDAEIFGGDTLEIILTEESVNNL